jgi:hypothetical protein
MDLVNQIPDSAALGYGQDGYRRGLLMGSTGVGRGTLLGAPRFITTMVRSIILTITGG